MKDNKTWCVEAFNRMVRIRFFEETAERMHAQGAIVGSLHSSIGQEAEIVGACMALRADDYMMGNHRSHGHPIAKGAKIGPLMAEIFGKRTGICRGKGGSMHLADFSVGSIGETSIVGSGLPVATGAALASKLRNDGRIALCFFGDGASNEGTFHESLNLAAVWKLPVIYLCENNLYACTLAMRDGTAVTDIATRGAGYGIPGVVVDGQDAFAVFEVVSKAVARAREGLGPTLVEAKTYRYRGHAVNMGTLGETTNQGTASGASAADELAKWKGRDPIELIKRHLRGSLGMSDAEIESLQGAVMGEVMDALKFAQDSPFPQASELLDDLYA